MYTEGSFHIRGSTLGHAGRRSLNYFNKMANKHEAETAKPL